MKLSAQHYIRKYFYLCLLLFSVILLSIYTLLCIPFFIHRKTGIFLLTLVSYVIWTIFNRMFRITFTVDILNNYTSKDENAILISNHLSAMDFMLINEVAFTSNMLPYLKYMIKKSIQYIPILGFINNLGFLMLHRNYEKDKIIIKEDLRFFKNNRIPFWLVIFPEGTRKCNTKENYSKEFCIERGLKVMSNVLFPRHRGFVLSCEELKTHVHKVVDMTIYYEDGELPSLFNFIFGIPSGKFRMRVDEFNLSEITDYQQFLVDRFYFKDRVIEEWKQCNKEI